MEYGVALTTRNYRHLSAEARETLSLGLAHGHSLRAMASVLGRAPSTVNRELGPPPHAAIPIAPARPSPRSLPELVSPGERRN